MDQYKFFQGEKRRVRDSQDDASIDQQVVWLGGLKMGFSYQELYVSAESIHQNVGFSGYPLGGMTIHTALFGTVEDICKAQDPRRSTSEIEAGKE